MLLLPHRIHPAFELSPHDDRNASGQLAHHAERRHLPEDEVGDRFEGGGDHHGCPFVLGPSGSQFLCRNSVGKIADEIHGLCQLGIMERTRQLDCLGEAPLRAKFTELKDCKSSAADDRQRAEDFGYVCECR